MNKIKHLEGLRGVAALVVVFSHLKSTCFIDEFLYLTKETSNTGLLFLFKCFLKKILLLLTDGTLSVWIFWVLSSYVISIKFFNKKDNYDKVMIGAFSKRYFRLLFPVLASILFAYLLLKIGFMYNIELANSLGTHYQEGWLVKFYTFTPNFIDALKSGLYNSFFNYNRNTTYNAVLWSIQNEFLGSLFTFSIFGIIRHNKSRYLIYLTIMIIIIKLNLIWLLAFIIGYVLCDYDYSSSDFKFSRKLKEIETKIHKHNFTLLIISLLFILYGRDFMAVIKLPFGYHNLIMSVVIIYFCLRNSYYKKILSKNIPYWLGNISFGLYLIHLPIICSFTSYFLIFNQTLQYKLIASICTLIISLLLSVLFTKYVDKKGIIYANKIGNYFIQKT